MTRVNVRLLRYSDVAARAYPAPAFSNGFEADCWVARWCETCEHDGVPGAGAGLTGLSSCPITEVMIMGEKTPRELEEVALGGLANRYACTGYEVREGAENALALLPEKEEQAEPES